MADLKQAVAAIREGDRETASELLWSVIDDDPLNDDAYYWLSTITDDIRAKRQLLEQALVINTSNLLASKALTRLAAQSQPQPVAPPSSSEPATQDQLEPAASPIEQQVGSFGSNLDKVEEIVSKPVDFEGETIGSLVVEELLVPLPEDLDPGAFSISGVEEKLEPSEQYSDGSSFLTLEKEFSTDPEVAQYISVKPSSEHDFDPKSQGLDDQKSYSSSAKQAPIHRTTGRWEQMFPNERSVRDRFPDHVNELLQIAETLNPPQRESLNSLRYALKKYTEAQHPGGNMSMFLSPAIQAAGAVIEGLNRAGRYGDAYWAANTFGEMCKILLSRNSEKYQEDFDHFVLAACCAVSGTWLASPIQGNQRDDQPAEIEAVRERLLKLCGFALGTFFKNNEGKFVRNFKPDEELRDWAINETLARHFDARLRQLLQKDRTRIRDYVSVNLPIVYKLQLDPVWDGPCNEWEQMLTNAGYRDLLDSLRTGGVLIRVDKVGQLPPDRLEEARRAASNGDLKRVRELLRDSADELRSYLFAEAQALLDFREPGLPKLSKPLNDQFVRVRRMAQTSDPERLREALHDAREVWQQDIGNIVMRDWVAYLLAKTDNAKPAEQMLDWIRKHRDERDNFATDWNLAVLYYQKNDHAGTYKLLEPLLEANSTDQDLILVVLALALKLGDRERFLTLIPHTHSLQFHPLAILVALDMNDSAHSEELLGQFLRQGEEQWKLPPVSALFNSGETLQAIVNRAIVEGQVDQVISWLRGRISLQKRWPFNYIELARVLEQEYQDVDQAYQALTDLLEQEKHWSPRNQRFIDDAARDLLELCRRSRRTDLGERAFKAAVASNCSQDLLESFGSYRKKDKIEPAVQPPPVERPQITMQKQPSVDPALADRVIWVNARLASIRTVRQYVDESRAIDELGRIVSEISPEARDTVVKLIQDTSSVIENYSRTTVEDRDPRRVNYDRATSYEKRLAQLLISGALPSTLADVIAPYHKALKAVLGELSKEAGEGPKLQAAVLNEFMSLDPGLSTLVLRVTNESERIATNVSVDPTIESPVFRLVERRPLTIASLEAQGSQVVTFAMERNYAVPDGGVREIGVNINLLASAENFTDYDLGVIQRTIPVKTLREAIGVEMIPKLFQPSRPMNPNQPELFRGRNAVLDKIRNTFDGGTQRERFFLDGIRRVGKTSILNFLPACLPDTVAPVSVNLDHLGVTSIGTTSPILLHRFCQLIGKSAAQAGNMTSALPDLAQFEANPGDAFSTFISSLRSGWPGRVPLLMIDELQVLLQAVRRCGSGRDQDTLVLDLLRGFMDDGTIVAIFTGSVRYDKLQDIISHRIIGSLDRLRISFLDEENVAAVLDAGTQPWAKLPRETVRRVYELTGGYPRLAQTYGAGLVDLMNREHRTVATPSDVDFVTSDAILCNDELFSHWWPVEQLGQDEERFIETLFRNYPDRQVVGSREFLDAVSFRDRTAFLSALNNLRACEVLDSTRPEFLRFTGIVLRQWLQNQIQDGHLRIRRPETGAPESGHVGFFIDHENLVRTLERISRRRGISVPGLQDDRLSWFRPILDHLYAEAERRLGKLDHKLAVAFWERAHEAKLTPAYQKWDFSLKAPLDIKQQNAADFKLADEVRRAMASSVSQHTRLQKAIVVTGDGDLSHAINALLNDGVTVQVWGGSKETNNTYTDIVGEANVVVLDDVCGL